MSTLYAVAPHTVRIPATLHDDPTLTRQWLQERWLVGARWALVPLCLAIIPLVPTAGWLLPTLLAALLGLANAGIGYGLSHDVGPAKVHLARLVATLVEWGTTLAIIGLCANAPRSLAPALLLPILVLTAVRFGVRGLLAASGVASLSLSALVVVQVHVLHVLAWEQGAALLIAATLLVVWTALPIAASAHAAAIWHTWEAARWDRDDANLRRLQCGLSEREWQILPLLARDELTYAAIGMQLHISPETVKTHVRRMSSKIGGKGRRSVVANACRQGLLEQRELLPEED